MIHDSSDSDEDANFCGSEDQFEALFKQFKSGVVPRSPSPPAVIPAESGRDTPDDSPSSSKKVKESENTGDSKPEVSDVHELSTDSCDSNDPDVENILAEYHDFLKSYKGDPPKSKSKHSPTGPVNGATHTAPSKSKKGMTTRSATKPVALAPEVADIDDDIQSVPAANPSNLSKKSTTTPGPVTLDDCIDDDILEVVSVEREQQTVRVRWKGQIHRFRVYETDSVLRVKELLAETVGGVAAGEIQFYMNDNEIPLESWKSIKEINLEFTTIIEALRRAQTQSSTMGAKGSGPSIQQFEEELPPPDPTMISIRIQDGNMRKKITVVHVKKTAPLTNLRELYLAKSGLEGTKTIDQIKFMFDGEVVDLSETPNSLDFEEDECLDVIIK